MIGPERFLVAWGSSGQDREIGGLRTDAALAVLRLDATGAPAAALLQAGTTLAWQGQTVLQLDASGTAEARFDHGTLSAQVTGDVTPHAPLPERIGCRSGWAVESATLNGRPAKVQLQGECRRISLE